MVGPFTASFLPDLPTRRVNEAEVANGGGINSDAPLASASGLITDVPLFARLQQAKDAPQAPKLGPLTPYVSLFIIASLPIANHRSTEHFSFGESIDEEDRGKAV